MSEAPWGAGTATALGSMPGTDAVESARTVIAQLPDLTPFPELPERGVGADAVGRTAGMLVDLAVEVVPSGYRVAQRPGRDHRRAVDLLRWDLDAMEQAATELGAPRAVKVQAVGPWTLGAGVELASGHRVLTDHGALRDFTSSALEGLARHIDEVVARTGAPALVQLDEPVLPQVLAGDLPTPSGYGTVPAVPEPEARALLSDVLDRVRGMTQRPVIVHCSAPRPPVTMLRRAGADAVALDLLRLGEVSGELADAFGEAWQEGTTFLLGLVPSGGDPASDQVRELAMPAFDLIARLGFPNAVLRDHAVPTPCGGLVRATPSRAQRALKLSAALARMFAEEAAA
ncbi:uroporphyrinogen decarboxylase/cobalamine-independent methonine synthase family protein [Salinifilum aidingensis]